MTQKNICILPARSGSKRIPGKNWKKLNGIPIIIRTISSIQKSNVFDEIYVSTDSAEVRGLVEPLGVKVGDLRPSNLSDDTTPILPVIQFEIKRNGFNLNPDNLITCVFPTAAFLKPDQFKDAYDVYSSKRKSGDMSLLICATKFRHPIDRALEVSENGNLVPVNEIKFNMKTQDLPDRFYDAGQFYFGSAETWLDSSIKKREFNYILVDESDVFDIDNMSDWNLAEKRMKD
jgi:pseudaminic acid cytidylyltransferase